MTQPLFLRALRNEPLERPPVWLMRQAGRYLDEYRALKAQHGFLGLCKNPELAAEITLQPVRAFDVDAAILFADILLPAECLGIQVDFAPGPKIANPIKRAEDIAALQRRDVTSTVGYVFDAVSLISKKLRDEHTGKTLIGFAGAPWTLACYLIDQGPYKHFAGTQVFAAQFPEEFQQLLTVLSDLVADYLHAQIESGAEVVQLFDSWGGILSREDYKKLSLPSIQRIFTHLGKRAPRILYLNGSSHLLGAMKESGADCLSVDWRTSLAEARQQVGDSIALQGNLDPTHLFCDPREVHAQTRQMVETFGRRSGYIANLGHGVLPGTPRKNVETFVKAVQQGWAA